ncbi:hypothetical protein TNCV_2594541 [Trichonephila clavipes]|nr:hypothetical protein TNCV_2594541 [Trichonephila clavipes]
MSVKSTIIAEEVLMVWAGMLDDHTHLHVFERDSVTGVRYRDEVLEPNVCRFMGACGPEFILMDAGKWKVTFLNKQTDMQALNSTNFAVKSPSASIFFTANKTPEKVYEINENREVSTPLKGSIEIDNFSPKKAANVSFCSQIGNEIAKGDVNFTPVRPKTFSCRRRQNVSYFSCESPKGILRSVPMEFGTPDFHNERTLCETLESTESERSVAEIWSNISLNSFKNRKSLSAYSEHSDISSTEMIQFKKKLEESGQKL